MVHDFVMPNVFKNITVILHLTFVSVHKVKVRRKAGNSPDSLTAFEFNFPLSSSLCLLCLNCKPLEWILLHTSFVMCPTPLSNDP